VAQDGTRVRASAGAPSFRSEPALQQCREQAALHLKAVLAEQDDPEATEAEKRARLAAALDYQRRVHDAVATVKDVRDDPKRKKDSSEPRASTTDDQARVMKMADGGFRPAYNIQMASAGSPLGGPRTIVAAQVTNVGSDMGSVTPMLAQIEARTGQLPEKLLADANHANHDCIRRCAELGVEALIPVPSRSQKPGAKADHDDAVAAWRTRMSTAQAKRVYRARASLCELPNAHLKQHQGLAQVVVRGLGKVTCVAMLAELEANLVQHAARLLR